MNALPFATARYPTVTADVCFAVVITRIEFETQSETKEAQNPISALRVSLAPPVYVSGTTAFSELYVTNLNSEQNRHIQHS